MAGIALSLVSEISAGLAGGELVAHINVVGGALALFLAPVFVTVRWQPRYMTGHHTDGVTATAKADE